MNDRYLLTSRPVKELEKLRKNSIRAYTYAQKIAGEKEIVSDSVSLMQSELIFEFSLADSRVDSSGIILENSSKEKLIIGYSSTKKNFFVNRTSAGNSAFSGKFAGIATAPYKAGPVLKLHLFIDASSAELFVDDGKLVMTDLVFPAEKFNSLILFSEGGEIILNNAELYSLNGIWR